MFVAFCVFSTSSNKSKDQPVTLVDSWVPNTGLSLDTALSQAGLPSSSTLQDFCFPKKKTDLGSGCAPPSLNFAFTLTNESNERAYGFCLRCQAVDTCRLDVGGDAIETSCFITRLPLFRLFPLALQIVRVRRALDKMSAIDFIQNLYSASPQSGSRILVESPFLSVQCKYELPSNSEPPLQILFDTTNPFMLHHILGAMLLERRIIFVGRTEHILSYTINALVFLMCGNSHFPHILIPIVPISLLERGVSSPTPYVVGILRAHLKNVDKIPQLGDFVIVDLDTLTVRISPGGASILPFGVDRSEDQIVGGIQRKGSAGQPDEFRPWADVCGPFSKDITLAYSQRDDDLLQSSVRALVSILHDGTRLDDANMKAFHSQYKKSQISTTLVPETKALGNRGYVAVRVQLSSNLAQSSARDRHLCMESKKFVDMLTSSNSTLKKGQEITRVLAEVAKRSFDAQTYLDASQLLLKSRLSESAGRNWKFGFRTLAVYDFLAKAGSEIALASCWDMLNMIFGQTRFSAQGVVGVPARVTLHVRKRALQVYELLVDLSELRWLRSSTGHILMLRSERSKMLQNIPRLPIGHASLMDLLAKSKPAGVDSFVDSCGPSGGGKTTPTTIGGTTNPFGDDNVNLLLNFSAESFSHAPAPIEVSPSMTWDDLVSSSRTNISPPMSNLTVDDWFSDLKSPAATSYSSPSSPILPPPLPPRPRSLSKEEGTSVSATSSRRPPPPPPFVSDSTRPPLPPPDLTTLTPPSSGGCPPDLTTLTPPSSGGGPPGILSKSRPPVVGN